MKLHCRVLACDLVFRRGSAHTGARWRALRAPIPTRGVTSHRCRFPSVTSPGIRRKRIRLYELRRRRCRIALFSNALASVSATSVCGTAATGTSGTGADRKGRAHL